MAGAVMLVRGRLCWFEDVASPDGTPPDPRFFEDGAMLVRDGSIIWSGDWADRPQDLDDAEIMDHRPHLIMPGFIDPHIHFPQGQVVASYAGSLLEWLNSYTFVEEQRYGNVGFAAKMAARFLEQLVSHGTTSCVAFGSVHKASADALLSEAHRRNMRIVAGKVMMDRNAPDALTDTPQSGYDDTKALIAKWHGQGRVEVAITPRFALTSTTAQMTMSGALVREHRECLVQTHLSENPAEIETALDLFPWAKDYTDIYDHFGLLTDKSLMGHCIHLGDREVACLAQACAVTVFCPTSNLFLGSGLFDQERIAKAGGRVAVATDIGGGTSWSMLRTLDEGYKILNCQGQRWHPYTSFAQATLGNAKGIGMAEKIGTLEAASEADFIVLDANATSAMSMRMETVETLAEELFVLQTMGDDRAVRQTYVAGAPQKPER
ncbi:MAG: guanine deaminase [Pseudomonadota bacterium]